MYGRKGNIKNRDRSKLRLKMWVWGEKHLGVWF